MTDRIKTWLLPGILAAGLLPGFARAATPDASFAQHKGGTLKLVAASAAGTIDPQVNYTNQYWQTFINVYDGLVTFRKTSGKASNEIVPDLATAVPAPTDNGLTYVFTLRKGIKFSNGKPVTVADVVASFERIFKVNNPNAGSWYKFIVGGDACMAKPAACTLPKGVIADAASNTITFHLVSPDPEFLDQLAVPFAVILPADTPAKDMGTVPVPGTGPYMITSYNPQKALILKRNPYFKQWSAEAQPNGYVDEIDFDFGVTDENAVTAIENGQYDWEFDPLPADRLGEVSTRFPNQVHIDPLLADYYAPMNVNIPPFNNKDARLAVNYALDRQALVNIFGGRNLATPACQILPPDFPGYKPYCPYTLHPGTTWSAPNMAKAQALMKKSGEIGQKVTVITDDQGVDPALGTYMASLLNKLGFVATTHVLSANIQFNYIQNTKNKVQISVSQWYQDYPAASDFLNVLLTCGAIHPGSDSSINISGYCSKTFDQHVDAVLKTEISDPAKANQEWAAVDREATDAAPWATMFTPKQLDFVSKRVGDFVFSDQFHMLFSKIWVK
ncbi:MULTISPECIES: ABC transporter substrate-binding protein [Acidiphilium]|uniref:Peptide/nickel transport system substrate-binding protein n=1 Tax=Acidiphilium rubrum TaxID=526 RepID=A0A8G2CK72_ACIRU|nr:MULTISPECIES: ABC transporter substrate-binding protein [Acidiphilium]SIQ70012.1 peptide/nickel transport system substrate-binding protein [Acidiphilium rubrum]